MRSQTVPFLSLPANKFKIHWEKNKIYNSFIFVSNFLRYTVRDVSPPSYGYSVVDDRRGILGLCYVLGADLRLPRRSDLGYKNLVVAREAVGGKRLEPRGAFNDHARWGACQVGAAADFVRREDLARGDGDLALFGAPGCFTWRGNLLGKSVGSIRRADAALKDMEEAAAAREFDKHGHMGLAVTSGRYFSGEVHYVAGAPHSGEGRGKVHFFGRDGDGELRPERAAEGEEFGAGFGYSLATLDANGDTSSDLAVGAPFRDGGKTGRGGAVHLYLSRRGRLRLDRAVRIAGADRESQFGLSLASLGDLNRDGFADFAAGAPYEDGGRGAVYVFLGGPSGLRAHGPTPDGAAFLKAEEVADQVIRARDLSSAVSVLPPRLSGLGVSLAGGGMDADGNGYPDLLAGAYGSGDLRDGAAVLLRARPIIDISTYVDDSQLRGIDPGSSGCPDDEEAEEACFGFKACFSVDREVSERGLGLKFEIEAEPGKPVSRVWLRLLNGGGPDDSREKRVEESIRLRNGRGGRREQHCTPVVGYVSTHADLQTPVQFAMRYSLIQEEPRIEYDRGSGRELPDIDDYPILNQAQAKKTFQVRKFTLTPRYL